MDTINETNDFPELEEKCLCCGKKLEKEEEQLIGFCEDCQREISK